MSTVLTNGRAATAGPGAAMKGHFLVIFLEISFLFFVLNTNEDVQVHGFTFNHHSHRINNNNIMYPLRTVSLSTSRSQPMKSFFTPSSTSLSTSSSITAIIRRPKLALLVHNYKHPLSVSVSAPLSSSLSSSSSPSSLYYKSKDDNDAGDEEVIINATMEDLDLVAPPPSPTTAPSAVSKTDTGSRNSSKSSNSTSRSKRVLKSSPVQNLITIESFDEFTKFINEKRDKVVVVRFFASWCKTCKQSEPSFFRFARKNPDIIFINIPFSRNNKIFEELHVSAVPYGHVYHFGELIEEMSLMPKHFSEFEKTVKNYHVSIVSSLSPQSSPSSLTPPLL